MKRLSSILFLSLLLAACGGPSSSTTRASSDYDDEEEEDDDGYIDEEPEDEDDRDDSGFIDDALRRGSAAEPLELAERREVPGTGVSIRPPQGVRAMPFGGGFIAVRQRLQISVVVAEGTDDVLEAIRTGGNPDAPAPSNAEEHTVSGQTGRIGRDRVETQQGMLERHWLLVHDGTRGLGVVATYEIERAAVFRPGVREMLESVEWDNEAELDASRALGIQVGPVVGLELSRRSTANLVLLERDAPFPPEVGQVLITVAPLPMQVPPDQVATVCSQIAARLVPVPAEDVEAEGEIDDGQLPGCERLATAETSDGERVVTYAALLFNGSMPILLSGSVAAENIETWQPRFASAARSVRLREEEE